MLVQPNLVIRLKIITPFRSCGALSNTKASDPETGKQADDTLFETLTPSHFIGMKSAFARYDVATSMCQI